MATLADHPLSFDRRPHPAPLPTAARDAILADPGFGTSYTDHMVSIDWDTERGWHDAVVTPREPLLIDPACAVLHYAQEIFEGLKAYRQPDGSAALFRPHANADRFNASAVRLAMPEMPPELFVEAVRQLVAADRAWLPAIEGGALYLRPFMFASEAFLGVRPARRFKFLVIGSPAGNYFKSGAPAVSLWISGDYTRAAPGGTGAAKCGGNYASSLVPQAEAIARGHDQVVFLDAVERRWVEELGGMNLYFVFDDGSLVTPPLSGTILAGITRDSLMQLARDEGLTVREERYGIDQWEADANSGRLVECFACGTAAVVTGVGSVSGHQGSFTVGGGGPGQLTQKLKARLVSIQRGEAPDPHGWMMRLG